jgi:hypothetical protein
VDVRTLHLDTLPFYLEWGAESIREKRGGLWGWERKSESRDFSLEFYFGDEVFYPDELNAFTTIEPGFAKVWVVFGWVGSHPDVYPDHLTFLDPRFITNVVMYFRHRCHGCRLSHLGGLSIPDP